MYKKVGVFLYTMLSTINANVIGQLRMNEIVVLLSAPFVFRRSDLHEYPYLKKVLLALLALLMFQVITDVFVVHTTAQNFMRGWAATIISMLSFIFLFKTLNDQSTILFFIGMTIIRNIIYTDDIVDSDMSYFKFKIAPILSYSVYLIVFWLYARNELKMALAVMIGYSLLCFASDTRSTGVIFFLSAIIIWFMNTKSSISGRRIAMFSIVFAALFQLCYVFYVNAVLNNEIGGEHSRAQLQRLDNPYNPLGLLMTGRAETFAAATAITDAPLFGHGSWAVDKTLKYYMILLSFHDEDMNVTKAYEKDRLIPSHSVLMGAWVNAGLGGFLAVCCLFWFLLQMGFYIIRNGQELQLYPVLVLMTVGLIWTFLFSPIQHLRFNIPAIAAIIMTSYYELAGNTSAQAEEMELPALNPI